MTRVEQLSGNDRADIAGSPGDQQLHPRAASKPMSGGHITDIQSAAS
jgi:hypothetical protein